MFASPLLSCSAFVDVRQSVSFFLGYFIMFEACGTINIMMDFNKIKFFWGVVVETIKKSGG
jgi:hypothetical protein